MKKTILFLFSMWGTAAISSYSQNYTKAADTIKLNKEYKKISNEIADLSSQLNTAQKNLPEYKAKANAADLDAQKAAQSSSEQASKATNATISSTRSAKREAKKAFKEAKQAKSANNDVSKLEHKITKLNEQLTRKQNRLQNLDSMRATINGQISH